MVFISIIIVWTDLLLLHPGLFVALLLTTDSSTYACATLRFLLCNRFHAVTYIHL